jgi:hypothetical protein
MKVYKVELAVASTSVTVSAGGVAGKDIASTESVSKFLLESLHLSKLVGYRTRQSFGRSVISMAHPEDS